MKYEVMQAVHHVQLQGPAALEAEWLLDQQAHETYRFILGPFVVHEWTPQL